MRRGESTGRDSVEKDLSPLFPSLGTFFAASGENPAGPPLPAAGAAAGAASPCLGLSSHLVRRTVEVSLSPLPGGPHPLRERCGRGTWLLGIRERQLSWKTEDRPGQRGWVSWPPGPRQEPLVPGNLSPGTKDRPSGATPDDPYTSPHPLGWRWESIRAVVSCSEKTGSRARVGGGRRWKALVALRILPSLASSCCLRPGCPHRPVSARSQSFLPKKSRGGRGVRVGADCGQGRG